MRKDTVLKALEDYSGEFLPGLNLGDFSHDTMIKLLDLYSQLYIAMDGFWYLTVMERSGNEEALACDMGAWEKMARYEMKKITEALNIERDNVVDFMKALQITPWCRKMQFSIDIENRNNATFTVTYCPTLAALEKEGKGREAEICSVVEPKILNSYTSFFNPDMQMKSLTPLPRKNKDDICCRWSISMET